MDFDGWFFKGGSTQNRWAFMNDFFKGGSTQSRWVSTGDFPKGGVHKTDGFQRVIFQRGEYTKPMAFDGWFSKRGVHKTDGFWWVFECFLLFLRFKRPGRLCRQIRYLVDMIFTGGLKMNSNTLLMNNFWHYSHEENVFRRASSLTRAPSWVLHWAPTLLPPSNCPRRIFSALDLLPY